MNKRIKKKQILMENKRLCKRYPFLIPRHVWTDKILWKVSKYDWRYTKPYSYTELDAMPRGWRKKFGIQVCEELREELIKNNFLKEYRVAQIKEKYGELRWYDFGVPKDSKVWDIIQKYTELSRHTCIYCGRPAKVINNNGWYEPVCKKCEAIEAKK